MKKSVFRFLVTVATVAAVGFAVAGCNNGNDDNGNNGGTGGDFTLTDIPAEYEGKFALLLNAEISKDKDVFGFQSVNYETGLYTLPKITNGKVIIPMWEFDQKTDAYKRWAGNATASTVTAEIYATENVLDVIDDENLPLAVISFNSVTFTAGNATVKYTDKK